MQLLQYYPLMLCNICFGPGLSVGAIVGITIGAIAVFIIILIIIGIIIGEFLMNADIDNLSHNDILSDVHV